MKRETVFSSFFLALFVLAMYQFWVILEPFLTPILGAIVLAIVYFPIHRALSRVITRGGDTLRAAVSTLCIVILIVIPFATLFVLLLNEFDNVVPLAQEVIAHMRDWYHIELQPWVGSLTPMMQRYPLLSRLTPDRLPNLDTFISGSLLGKISSLGQGLAANTLLTSLNLFVMGFALFFLLRDGERMVATLKKSLPLNSHDKERILRKVETTVTGIVRGSVLTALFQTLCATVGYFIVGVPDAVTLGLLTGMASVIPVVGTALIWAPTALYLMFLSAAWKGVFLLVWGGVVIGVMDNFVRSYLIGRQAKLHVFLLFIGLVGGIRVYGLRGLLIGPLLVTVIPILLDIFETEYLSEK